MTVFFYNGSERGGHEAQAEMFANERRAEFTVFNAAKILKFRSSNQVYCLGTIYQNIPLIIFSFFVVSKRNRFIYLPFFRKGQRFHNLKIFWLKFLLRHFSLITISKFEQRYLRKFCAKAQIDIRKNYINHRNLFVTKSDLNEANVYLIGRLYSPQKGIQSLERFLPNLKKYNISLIGDNRANNAQIPTEFVQHENINFLGFIQNPWNVIDGVLLVPSIYEGLPLVIMEAYLNRVPVLVNNIPELRVLVKPAYRFDFFSGSPEELTEKLSMATSNPLGWPTQFLEDYMKL
ncbi:glycosyltransferase [Cognatishimia sp. SS12]|uniref:glycosyltransferase n=1 Tax=Cognatishimia sp. SS12 TaxID=2979465 RepID=UPI00232FE228|nr:glycosyltransferase [Cognatishimia sp. SS12]MDC0739680.1 glycosyltransferase [Cognatishimia sp. SS12]